MVHMKKLYAVSDIHGQYFNFKEALISAGLVDLELKWKDDNNKLIICGDNIDRGPDSLSVLDLLIELSKSESVVVLMGNHEEMLLNSILTNSEESKEWFSIWINNGGLEFALVTISTPYLLLNSVSFRSSIFIIIH